jgi:2-C-methyl-D-erythritol 4-phosphate cytidylyltransferase
MIYAVLLAGGSGQRMQMDKPKQFMEFDGKSIMEYTIEKFDTCEMIDEIVAVMNENYIDEAKNIIRNKCFNKNIHIISGGSTRQASSYEAIKFLKDKNAEIVVFHDMVRPFINHDIIEKSIEETKEHGAVDVCVKTTDTIIKNKDGFVDSIPDRSELYNGQTPQVFKYDIITKAHETALEEGFTNTTDDVKLVLRIGNKVKIVEGSYENIKLTTQSDIELFSKIISKRRGM